MAHVGRRQDWVIDLLMESPSTTPADLLEAVMADPRCAVFGPIHHFIVGAVLLTCWRNAEAASGRDVRLRGDLEELIGRSDHVPGAACAQWGVCGAAASVGMAYAIVRGNAPLRDEGWQDAQLLVAQLLTDIAEAGSPRCCKRDARIAIREAVPAFNALGGPQLNTSANVPRCAISDQNSVCMHGACPYWQDDVAKQAM